MTPMPDAVRAVLDQWRERAEVLEPYAPAAAAAFRRAAVEIEAAITEGGHEELTLAEACADSGYSERRLRELIADGTIPQAGRKGAPRIRRQDLPRRARRSDVRSGYDAEADAHELLGRLNGAP